MYSTIKLGFMHRKNILLDLIQGKTFLALQTRRSFVTNFKAVKVSPVQIPITL